MGRKAKAGDDVRMRALKTRHLTREIVGVDLEHAAINTRIAVAFKKADQAHLGIGTGLTDRVVQIKVGERLVAVDLVPQS